MQFYSKAALELVYDQVNRDNPHLPVTLTPANAALTSGPSAVSSNGRNTRAVFTGYPGSGVQGNVTLYYDRVNLDALFNFVPAVFLPDDVLTYRAALPFINEALGLSLLPADITTPDAALKKSSGVAQSGKLTIVSGCPAFTGNLNFTYMLEGAGYYPDSGPGPKQLLQGDTIMGYFGRVASSDLFTHAELVTMLLTGTGAKLVSGTEGWYKFFYQGTIIYLPVTPVANTISWSLLYGAGIVYGVDGVGTYPMSPAVNQGKILTKDTASDGRIYLRPKLPTASKNDPMTTATGTLPIADTAGSVLDLMLKVRDGTWESNSYSDWSQWVQMRNSVQGQTQNNKLITMLGQSATNVNKTTAGAGYYWWPVLELVDKNGTTLGLEELRGNVDRTLTPITFTPQLTLQIAPIAMTNAKTVEYSPILFGTENSLAISPTAFALPKTVDFTPITFSAEIYTPPAKPSLSTMNGELDGFK
ncbi:virion structural protein [Erwinia phage vB_EamM_ChrisDB]|uniref:virion structural protein n=1 Tax=Erwinia phage vB_EamM_ChrisDB TaxID=1883371 RepID=UPI00081CA931|nr:virion structural protein [Erwinia phage vB_EamM_ChrisDB]ANZ48724.1 putative virion structural protein [Erwinia phage vB_EamM_ChrisDB]